MLAKEQYIKRHDRVCAQLHFNMCKEIWVQLDKKPLVCTCAKIGTNKSRRQRNQYGSPEREHLEVTVTCPHHKGM